MDYDGSMASTVGRDSLCAGPIARRSSIAGQYIPEQAIAEPATRDR